MAMDPFTGLVGQLSGTVGPVPSVTTTATGVLVFTQSSDSLKYLALPLSRASPTDLTGRRRPRFEALKS